MLADLPKKQAAKHSRHSGWSMQTRLRTPSCHGGYQIQKLVLYSNLLTIYGMLCASSRGSYVQSCVESYVQSYICASSYDIVVLMCLFWFIWQASGAGSHSAFPHTMWLDDDEEICCGKQAKEDINFIAQKMFSYGPYIWVSQVFAILCFLLVSSNLLSLIFLLIAATGVVRVLKGAVRVLRSYVMRFVTRLWRKGLHLFSIFEGSVRVLSTRSYAIVTKRASSTLRKASVPHLCRGGHIAREKCSGWHTHTHRRRFRRTCHKSLFCKFNWQACCSAEGARYIDPL